MALQTDRLSMVGLGIEGDVPPVGSSQPAGLVNGVHLRWATRRELGFPWWGFYLFRRPHVATVPVCLSTDIGSRPVGGLGSPTLAAQVGAVSSDANLVLTEAFASPAVRELDLDDRSYVQVERPIGQPAYGVEATIGLREPVGVPAGSPFCIDFNGAAPTGPNPRTWKGATFQAFASTELGFSPVAPGPPAPSADTQVTSWPTFNVAAALVCQSRLRVLLPCTAAFVEVTTCGGSADATIVALGAAGNTLRQATARPGPVNSVQLFAEAEAIVAVEIRGVGSARGLVRLCFTCRPRPAIEVTAYSGATPVARGTAVGGAGQVVSVKLRYDCITSVRVSSGPASLVDLCFLPVTQGATQGWQPLAPDPNPLSLPVRDPSYPCNPQAPDLALSRDVALNRVRYGSQQSYAATFDDLHPILRELVVGGPAVPMAARSTAEPGVADPADPNLEPPTMPKRYPLDLVLLGSLHPAIAQMVGLYWADQSAVLGTSYDYLVVADHRPQSPTQLTRWQGNAQILAELAANGFTNLDGFIAFDLVRGPAAKLAPPQDVRAYVLPGTTIAAQGVEAPKDVTLAAGLRWTRTGLSGGALVTRDALLFHVWRAGLGIDIRPAAQGTYARLTSDAPVLIGDPPPGVTPVWPQGGPSLRIFYYDNGVSEGWYGYKVSGTDIFGRESEQSAAARWFRWTPPETVIEPAAVQLIDKTPPPMPTAIEAYALDPADPTLLRDTLYTTWFATLSATEKTTLIGLRVRWKWTTDHMRQAPDTKEFRIYFNPGSKPPAYGAEAVQWSSRYYAVAYGASVTVTNDPGDGRLVRNYELIIPAQTDAVRASVPLTPTLATPVVYANVGVSASDNKASTADAPKWASGNFGGRPGNEGRVGPAATIFRVLRTLPPAPVVPADSERVYASPADYHSRSFYTYRWAPSANLKTHVFRALDESVFASDWAQRPRTALGANDTSAFPPIAVDPRWDSAKRQQVAAELNALNAISGQAAALAAYRKLSNDALRVLAGLPGNDGAFSQLTIEPLDPVTSPDVRGPDNPATYAPNASLRAYVDTLDGRSASRYFYRAAYVDGAHNLGPLSLSGPPVYLPDVVRPSRPRILKALGGDRRVALEWAAHTDRGISRIRVYRSATEADARDIRLMSAVADLPAAELIVAASSVELGAGTDVGQVERVYQAAGFNPDQDLLTGQTAPQYLATPGPPTGTKVNGVSAPNGTGVVVVYRDSKQQLQHTRSGNRRQRWTDAKLAGARSYYYRLVAVRLGETASGAQPVASEPSEVAGARAVDLSAPAPPTITTIEWVRVRDDGTVVPFADPIPAGETRATAVRLEWTSPDPKLACLVQTEVDAGAGFANASRWLARGVYSYVHRNDATWQSQRYQVKVISEAGNANTAFAPATIAAVP